MGRSTKGKEKDLHDDSPAAPESDAPVEEEYSVEKVIDRRLVITFSLLLCQLPIAMGRSVVLSHVLFHVSSAC